MRVIDKVAWVHLVNGRVLSTRSRGKDTCYLPGGKREPGESDEACLRREIKEELGVDLDPQSLRKLGTWESQAHGNPAGVRIVMPCYEAGYTGELRASAEIEEEFSGDKLQNEFKRLEKGSAASNVDARLLELKQKMGMLPGGAAPQSRQLGKGVGEAQPVRQEETVQAEIDDLPSKEKPTK